jgi:hypothetical protein
MVITPSGSVYALVIINISNANTFSANYPSQNIGFGPDFPDQLFDEANDVKLELEGDGTDSQIAEEMAMAYILDKYNAGIALLKQDGAGNFKRLRTEENTVNGNTTYTANNCQ